MKRKQFSELWSETIETFIEIEKQHKKFIARSDLFVKMSQELNCLRNLEHAVRYEFFERPNT